MSQELPVEMSWELNAGKVSSPEGLLILDFTGFQDISPLNPHHYSGGV